jgi:hypothetical protein
VPEEPALYPNGNSGVAILECHGIHTSRAGTATKGPTNPAPERPRLTSEKSAEVKLLKHEVAELRRANEISRRRLLGVELDRLQPLP